MPPSSLASLFSAQDVIAFISIALLIICSRLYMRYRHMLYVTPPGPKPIPFLGNVLDIPSKEDWLTYANWAKIYNSDLISIRAFGHLTIIVNSAKAAKELLGRRASNYSDRPRLAMLELIEWDWNTAFIGYGERWRERRRWLHRALNMNAVTTYHPLQARFTHKFLGDLRREPKLFSLHIEHLTAELSLYVAYGIEDRDIVDIAQRATEMLFSPTVTGWKLDDPFIVKYLPEWLPGTSFHAFARKSRTLTRKMRFDSLARVKEQLADGTAQPSLALSMLHSMGDEANDEVIADVAAIIFAGGSDTTAAALRAAIQAFAFCPHVQRQAQAELDAIVGRDRLPEHGDRSSMPYVEAVCREVLRWHTVTPLGAPRRAIADDVYEGKLIPAGSTVVWNAWAISHDPETYESPFEFKPERFINELGQLSGAEDSAFGYGRRECVGMHFLKATLWIAVASMLSVFEFSKAKDENGNEIEISVERTPGLMSHPVPFECDIRPRDAKAIELIQSLSLGLSGSS